MNGSKIIFYSYILVMMSAILIIGLGGITSQAELTRLTGSNIPNTVTRNLSNAAPQTSVDTNSYQDGETEYEEELLNIYKTPPTKENADKRNQEILQLESVSKVIQSIFK